MPKNRAALGRQDKIDEIVGAAKRRLVDDGYAALSVAAIARQLGLAQAAIYWYFPTKDHLFVAALESILHDVLRRKPGQGTALDQVTWFLEQLSEFQDLRMALRERARRSEVVATFETDVNAVLREMLVGALHADVGPEEMTDTADAVMALCEGVLLRDVGRRRRRELIRFGFPRLIAPISV